MSGFDPEVLKRAANDPAILLPLVGAVLPNVTHGTSTYKPGQVIGALGSAYGTVRDEAELQKMMRQATTQMGTAAVPPAPQPMFRDIPVDPMEMESRPQDLAHAMRSFRPVQALSQFYTGLAPEQQRVFLKAPPSSLFGRGTPPAISVYETFQKSTEGQQEQEARVLFGQAMDRLLKDPLDENAQKAVAEFYTRFGKDPGTALVLNRDWEQRRRAYLYLKRYADDGNQLAQESMDRGDFVGGANYFLEKKARTYTAQEAYEAVKDFLTPESRSVVKALAAVGVAPDVKTVMDQQAGRVWSQMVSQYRYDFELLGRGKPMSDVVFAGILGTAEYAPFAQKVIEMQQRAVGEERLRLQGERTDRREQQQLQLAELGRLGTILRQRETEQADLENRARIAPELVEQAKRGRTQLSAERDAFRLRMNIHDSEYNPGVVAHNDMQHYEAVLQSIVEGKAAANARWNQVTGILIPGIVRDERLYGHKSPEWLAWKQGFMVRIQETRAQLADQAKREASQSEAERVGLPGGPPVPVEPGLRPPFARPLR